MRFVFTASNALLNHCYTGFRNGKVKGNLPVFFDFSAKIPVFSPFFPRRAKGSAGFLRAEKALSPQTLPLR